MRNIRTCLHSLFLLACLCFCVETLSAQDKTVKGIVVDEMNEPMMGVTIKVPDSTIGTVSDLNGNFILAVDNSVDELQISYIGYVTQLVKITSTPMRIILREDTQMLESVVVIGYEIGRAHV